MNEKLEIIANLIQGGCTSGYYPYWVLTAEWEDDVTDIGLEIISNQVKEGCTSGYGYDDVVGLINWSIEIEESNDELSESNGY